MEEYFERNPAVKLLRELGLQLEEDVAHSSVRIDGKLYPYQGEGARDEYLAGIFNAEEREAFLRWNAKVWSLYTQLHASHYEGKPLPPELAALMRISFTDFVARDGLPHKVSEWIRVTVEPEMAIEWDKISALDGIDEMRLFLDSPEGFGELNYHVKGGNTRFIEALAAPLKPDQVMTQARVTAIEQTDTGVKLRVLVKDSRYIDVTGKLAVVTVPVHQLGRIQFSPALSPEKWQAIETTRMGSYIKVHFRLAPEAARLWHDEKGENVLTLLSDSPAGSIYDVSQPPGGQPEGERVLTLLLHARFARDLMNQPADTCARRARRRSTPSSRACASTSSPRRSSSTRRRWPTGPWSSSARASTRSPTSCGGPRAGSTSEATPPRTATRRGPSSPRSGWRGSSSSAGPS